MQKYIIMGSQGSGKGTQAKRLASELGVVHISMGEIFRWHMASGTWLADRIRENMDNGQLVPDEVVEEVVRDRLSRSDLAAGYILDGFPRTPAQAKFFLEHYEVDAVLVLQVSQEMIKKRILGRRLCRECGRDFNIYFQPPLKEGRCDSCGGSLKTRGDDTPEAIERRLQTYYTKTEPVIEQFRAKELVIDVDAEGDPESVNDQILKHLRQRSLAD